MSKHQNKIPTGRQEAPGGGIPETAAQQLDRLLPQSQYFIDAMTAYRNATADVMVELLRGVLTAHPEEMLQVMENLQKLRLPTDAEGTYPERGELVAMVQERLQPGAHPASGKKKR